MFKKLSFDNKINIVKVVLLLLAFILLFFLLVTPLYPGSRGTKTADTIISSLNIFFLYLMAQMFFRRYSPIIAYNIDLFKRLAVGLTFAIACYPGLSLLLELFLLERDFIEIISPTIPLRIAISLILFYIACLQSKNSLDKSMEVEESEPGMQALLPENTVVENSAQDEENQPILDRVAVKIREKLIVIPLEELYYLKADGDYVQLHTANASYLKEQTMKYFESTLPPHLFVRIHRSYIVNIGMISGIEQYGKHTRQITLKNGEKILVSGSGYKTLRERLGV